MQYIIQNNKNHWNHILKTPLAWKKLPKKGHFAHIGNEIKICSQNKCHHHLSNVCENSFRMFHSNWVISDYHSFVWQFEFPWMNLTNCQTNEWQSEMTQLLWNIRNEFSQTLERWWWHLFRLQILISLPIWAIWPFFGSFFHANGIFGIWYKYKYLLPDPVQLHALS